VIFACPILNMSFKADPVYRNPVTAYCYIEVSHARHSNDLQSGRESMSLDWDRISHITKVDPAKPLPDNLSILAETDLIVVGGSDGVTEANSLKTLRMVRSQCPDIPLFQEPYHSSQISPETVATADYLAAPAVYNGDQANFVTKHMDFFTKISSTSDTAVGSGLSAVGDLVASGGHDAIAKISRKILGEGYVIQNLDSKAARASGVEVTFTPKQIAGAALATESFYGFPIFYIEYSGTYGGPKDVEAAAKYLNETVLLYGGGIKGQAQTEEILKAGADAVVVGNCFHDDPQQYLQTMP
jgi:phosphoglycerol geranylgeranyltransferase